MNSKEFNNIFNNNFYQSEEFIEFSKRITGINNKNNNDNNTNSILNKKNISINNYSEKEIKEMEKNNIKYFSVINENNRKSKSPSLMEYVVWLYKPYNDAYKGFDKTFRKYKKRAEKLNYTVKIIRIFNQDIINKTYKLYIQHMRRLNGFIFPKSFFVEFLKLKSSLLFLIYDKDKLAGYSFCFENKDNLYASIGAGHKDYFDKYVNYKLYNEKIKYACKHKLNIHMGIGIKDSGYNNFKKRVGAICFKTKRFPTDDKFLRKILPLTKLKITGILCELISKMIPKKIIFKLMPFT